MTMKVKDPMTPGCFWTIVLIAGITALVLALLPNVGEPAMTTHDHIGFRVDPLGEYAGPFALPVVQLAAAPDTMQRAKPHVPGADAQKETEADAWLPTGKPDAVQPFARCGEDEHAPVIALAVWVDQRLAAYLVLKPDGSTPWPPAATYRIGADGKGEPGMFLPGEGQITDEEFVKRFPKPCDLLRP